MTSVIPVLAEIELDELLPQLVFVLVLLGSALKSIFDNKKKGQPTKRRRRPGPARPHSEEPTQFPLPVFLEPVEEPEPEPEPEVEELPVLTAPPEGRERRAPLGVDLDQLDATLPSRQEQEFESHRRDPAGLEGATEMPAMHRRADRAIARPRRRQRVLSRNLRRAVVMAEVLGAPVALRNDSLSRVQR